VSGVIAAGLRVATNCAAMNTKDTFMRFVVIGSIVAVGLFALFIATHS
jgi:hypothetical protein